MEQLLESAAKVAASDTPLLISGETGAGKEWVARWIHKHSHRADGPFLPVNCGAIPEGLFESEFFGHVRGAFTGATGDRRGAFQQANGGTLLLDEIGDIPPPAQSKLLRALQEAQVHPVGSDWPVDVDVRIIAATNRDLGAAVANREFRADLFYRLNVVELTVPPLRERPSEVPELVRQHVRKVSDRLRRPVRAVSDEALSLLQQYSWPGNVRELLNVVERALLFCPGTVLTVDDLPEAIRSPSMGVETTVSGQAGLMGLPLAEAREQVVARFEAAYLKELLATCEGHLGKAARAAGIHPRTLYNKMQEYGLRKEAFRSRGVAND